MNKCIYCQNPEAFQLEPAEMVEVPWENGYQPHKKGELVLAHRDKIFNGRTQGIVICKNHVDKCKGDK